MKSENAEFQKLNNESKQNYAKLEAELSSTIQFMEELKDLKQVCFNLFKLVI